MLPSSPATQVPNPPTHLYVWMRSSHPPTHPPFYSRAHSTRHLLLHSTHPPTHPLTPTAIASYLLTTEVTKRSAAGLLAAAFAGIVPSYISRSVGGSYDNEGVAIFALVFTFYLWVRLSHPPTLFSFYMVAAISPQPPILL